MNGNTLLLACLVVLASNAYALKPATETRTDTVASSKVVNELEDKAILDKVSQAIDSASKSGKYTTEVSTKGFSMRAWKQVMRTLADAGYLSDGYAPHTLYVVWR